MLGPPPAEVEALIARRRALGIDLFDEVWQAEHHFAPAPHPAHGYVEPDDETFAKSSFHRARGVEEILVADPAARSVRLT